MDQDNILKPILFQNLDHKLNEEKLKCKFSIAMTLEIMNYMLHFVLDAFADLDDGILNTRVSFNMGMGL